MPKSDLYKNSKGEQIDFTLKVYTRPNLRGSEGEMLMYMGKHLLETMFDKCVVDEKITDAHIEYPDRWCNILELRAIPDRMLVCFPNLTKMTITTHSVYIIQCVHAQHIRIYDDPSEYPEKSYDDLTVRYSPAPTQMSGLYQFGL